MNAPIVLSDLLLAYRQNKLPLADFLTQLSKRGAVQGPLHRADLMRLDEALKAKHIDEKIHRILNNKLRELQAPADDKTNVNPVAGGGDKTALNPAASTPDKTTINPATASGSGDVFDLLLPDESDDEKTQITASGEAVRNLRAASTEKSETTAFTPTVVQPKGEGPHTATGGASGPGTSSWNRLAATAGAVPEQNVYPGMMLKERFYLEKEVGRGGMGVVWKARDERKVEAQDKNPWIAVKILNDEFRNHPQSLIALQREARKAQQLTHDNILRVYDFDKAGTIVYITMEYADGGTVKEYIKKGAAKGGWTYAEGRKIIEGMAHGLARAHRDGIVHSDFKPGNVMVGEGNVAKVFDLGIARAAKTDEQKKSGETTVFDAATLGALTPAYASLEMMRGGDPQIPDDIYALAISTYEVLTGKHPYAKKNAEEAFKAGMKPAKIPSLTSKQWHTLQKGLAFERKNRLQTADELIEGMRPRTFKDYALPVAIGSGATIGLLALVFAVLLPKLQEARVDSMVQKFEQATFTDYNAAVQELAAMDETDRVEAKQKGSATLQDYFFKQAATKWSVAEKRYDYSDALAILKAAGTEYPDSKNVADNLERIDTESKTAITDFGAELDKRVAAGRIYDDQKDNAVEVLNFVRRIDPKNGLLNNEGLKDRYRQDIRQALQAKDLDLGEKRVASAVKAYPTDDSIKSLAADVKATRDTQLAALKKKEQLAAFAKMTPEQVRAELTTLSAAPDFSPDWQAQVDAAVGALSKDATPEAAQLRDTLVAVFSQRMTADTNEKKYASAQAVADLGLRLFPSAPGLLQEKSKLDSARKSLEAEQAAVAAKGLLEDMKVKLANFATADKIVEAEKVFTDMKARMPANDPYLSGDGPKTLGQAYERQARRFAGQGRYDQAQASALAGLRAAPGLATLKSLEREYGVEAKVARLESGARNPATANGDQLKVVLDAIKADDAARYAKLLSELPSAAINGIQALIPNDRPGAIKAKSEWLKVFPQDAKLVALVIPEAIVAAAAPAPSAAAPSTSLSKDAQKARGTPTPAVACLASYAGFGGNFKATCMDKVGGGDGPRLVVVPGAGGGLLAVTKFEITVAQYNAFCAATGKCKSLGGNENLPATGVSFAQAKAYAAWLSDTTGFNYRLPSDAEWKHVANAGGKGVGDAGSFNCVLMQGDTQIKGGGAIDVKQGKPNPWGLVNAIGNAAEWVDASGGVARGGSFNVPNTQCTVDWSTSGSGASDTVGLRLVREMG